MELVKEIVHDLASRDNSKSGDYFDDEGYLVCGQCNTRKQCDVSLFSAQRRVPCMCVCQIEQEKADKERWQRQEIANQVDALRKDGITDPAYLRLTFSGDDYRDKAVSEVCRKYVSRWDDMRRENIGVLLYGSVGTGKSFYACCIANALLEKCVPVCVTNFPRLLNRLQSGYAEDRQEIIDRLEQYHLLVIDDLGVERDTSYSIEQVYNVIDARARAKKPLIITTNLSLDDLKNPSSLAYSRIYDRVMEMCPITLKMTGPSRRVETASMRQELARQILKG